MLTPPALGFRMPAEWEPHEATWIAWPHERDDWPGRFAPIPWVYAEIVRKLSQVERVRILVQNSKLENSAKRVLRRAGAQMSAVEFHCYPTDRAWTRDYAPLFVKNAAGDVAITDWRFNGWAKYDNYLLDDAIPSRLAELLQLRMWSPDMVLEGGSIDVNGAGLLLTTEECLLSPVQARNPRLSRDAIEKTLSDYLGADRVLWLNRGIAGDDTHGHIDDIARFVDADTVVLALESESDDANYEPLLENFERLKQYPLRLVPLPMPAPLHFRGRRLPASYANFYIANRLVLVPTFNDPQDRVALNTLAELFPSRQVTGINCTDLIWGLGALHCMTQQQPTKLE